MTLSRLKSWAALAVVAGLCWAGSAGAQTSGAKREAMSYQSPGSAGGGQQVSADAARLRKARQLAKLINDGRCDEAIKQASVSDDTVIMQRVSEVCAPVRTANTIAPVATTAKP